MNRHKPYKLYQNNNKTQETVLITEGIRIAWCRTQIQEFDEFTENEMRFLTSLLLSDFMK